MNMFHVEHIRGFYPYSQVRNRPQTTPKPPRTTSELLQNRPERFQNNPISRKKPLSSRGCFSCFRARFLLTVPCFLTMITDTHASAGISPCAFASATTSPNAQALRPPSWCRSRGGVVPFFDQLFQKPPRDLGGKLVGNHLSSQ